MAMNLSNEFLLRMRGIWRCSKSLRITHLPKMTDFLESWMKQFSARSLTKGRLGLGVKDEEGTTVFPFSLLDLLDIMNFGEKWKDFRLKRLWLDLINKRPKDLDKD